VTLISQARLSGVCFEEHGDKFRQDRWLPRDNFG